MDKRLEKLNNEIRYQKPQGSSINISVNGGRSPMRGTDAGGGVRPIEVDENGNLRVDLVSGVSVSTVIDQTNTLMVNQISGSVWSVASPNSLIVEQLSGSAWSISTPNSILVDQVSGSAFSANIYNVRGSTVTGYANLVLAQETSVVDGISGTYIGLTSITGSNTSDNAIRVDIRTGTAGTVVDTLVVPATNVVSKTYEIPLPQVEAQQAWTAKVNSTGEISDSPVSITVVGIKQY